MTGERGWLSGIWVTEREQAVVTALVGLLLIMPDDALPHGLLRPLTEIHVGILFLVCGATLFMVSARRSEPADPGTRAYRVRFALRHISAMLWGGLGWWVQIWVMRTQGRAISLTAVLLVWLGYSMIRAFYHDWMRRLWLIVGGNDYHPGSN